MSKSFVKRSIDLITDYLNDSDWEVNENSNSTKSTAGMNTFLREKMVKEFWKSLYSPEIIEANETGAFHIHDMGFFGGYCGGWSLRDLIMEGFFGAPGKIHSKPPKHLSVFLGQIVNSTFTFQGELAGAQAWGNLDTYAAPFIYNDNLNYKQVKQEVQEFIHALNVPTRVGYQAPFTNVTLDLKPPSKMENEPALLGGALLDVTYGELQSQMDMFNKAFCEVMLEGDSNGRAFTFPIPTLNVTNDFEWDNEIVEGFLRLAAKYGSPYFANFINSDLSADDAFSMCCRLRIDLTKLSNKGGGFFGSNPNTGSIGVVTINLPQLAHLTFNSNDFEGSKKGFFKNLKRLACLARDSLETKRNVLEKYTELNLFPHVKNGLKSIKRRTGKYWNNHFSTIGIIGMNEALQNMGIDFSTNGKDFALEVLDFLKDIILGFQTETGNSYNLEATPAEGTSYRLALSDLEKFPEIKTSGNNETPFYTNSTQLPANATLDIFESLDHQNELQSKYTGGTVFHIYMSDQIEDIGTLKLFLKETLTNYKIPYFSITPTFSICENHGFLNGEQEKCGICGSPTEVWTRVVGFLRPTFNFNEAKKLEQKTRNHYEIK